MRRAFFGAASLEGSKEMPLKDGVCFQTSTCVISEAK
jgi:hypothetical protein